MEKLPEDKQAEIRKMASERMMVRLVKAGCEPDSITELDRPSLLNQYAEFVLAGEPDRWPPAENNEISSPTGETNFNVQMKMFELEMMRLQAEREERELTRLTLLKKYHGTLYHGNFGRYIVPWYMVPYHGTWYRIMVHRHHGTVPWCMVPYHGTSAPWYRIMVHGTVPWYIGTMVRGTVPWHYGTMHHGTRYDVWCTCTMREPLYRYPAQAASNNNIAKNTRAAPYNSG
jgi:hypothetical protein